VPNATNIEMLHFHSANKQRSATNFSSGTLNQIQRMVTPLSLDCSELLLLRLLGHSDQT
jgi:hypothetical protein